MASSNETWGQYVQCTGATLKGTKPRDHFTAEEARSEFPPSSGAAYKVIQTQGNSTKGSGKPGGEWGNSTTRK